MVKPKLSRGPKYSGGVPTLRMLNKGPPVMRNVPSGAPAHFGPMRNSPPMVTIQSGAAGTLAACAAVGGRQVTGKADGRRDGRAHNRTHDNNAGGRPTARVPNPCHAVRARPIVPQVWHDTAGPLGTR